MAQNRNQKRRVLLLCMHSGVFDCIQVLKATVAPSDDTVLVIAGQS